MEQKKFMDIQRLKEGYADGFVPGDLIVIQEKFDGSNAAARYDAETGKMVAFSRRHTLDQNNTLNGFYNYVQELNPEDYKDVPDYVIFGEWSEQEMRLFIIQKILRNGMYLIFMM